jgi:hypothetical protein
MVVFMTDRDLMQQALEALETADEVGFWELQKTVVSALRERLAQPEQEPHHWIVPDFGFLFPSQDAAKRYLENIDSKAIPTACYTTPPQRKPLTDEQATKIVQGVTETSPRPIGAVELGLLVLRAIEAAHNIKENT